MAAISSNVVTLSRSCCLLAAPDLHPFGNFSYPEVCQMTQFDFAELPASPAKPEPALLGAMRVLMYSHDTFGLGHLRRCSTIAHALVEKFRGVQVLIISGSPIAGAFDFRPRVDFIKIPSVVKLYNGEYSAMDSQGNIDSTLRLRESMIYHTAKSFSPDLVVVDKEPLGLKGEMERTLTYLKSRGCHLVLGLREVMDDPDLLEAEWARKDVLRRLDNLYDQVWVYGPQGFWNPLAGLDISAALAQRLVYTGFLRRAVPHADTGRTPRLASGTLLATTGGGGDGAELMRQVIAAHQHDPAPGQRIVLVPGPFMSSEEREDVHRRAAISPALSIIDFDTDLETLMQEAQGIICMGGYNTFCEVLSLDKRALIVPRLHPRREQLIRATRAAELGFADMLLPQAADDPATMARALRALPQRPPPSKATVPPNLDGLSRIADLVLDHARSQQAPHLSLVETGKAR